jgi:hypothetical protein
LVPSGDTPTALAPGFMPLKVVTALVVVLIAATLLAAPSQATYTIAPFGDTAKSVALVRPVIVLVTVSVAVLISDTEL